jgi:ATP-dependent Clp protease ATP-binding subunit ClpB
MTLEVERAALEREDDRRSKQRLPEVVREIAELKEQASGMKAQWQRERELIKSLRTKKEKLEQLKAEAERLQRQGDYARASELRFGSIPELDKETARDTAQAEELRAKGSFLREEVTEEDIAAVVAKWTGIGERSRGRSQRLAKMENRLREGVVGQDERSRRRRRRAARPRRPQGPQPADLYFLFLGRPAWARRASPSSCSTAIRDDRIDMSEYQEKHTVSRLVGAPPGCIGYDQGGQLTGRCAATLVILLDEMEKRTPTCGACCSGAGRRPADRWQGRTVDFRNTV